MGVTYDGTDVRYYVDGSEVATWGAGSAFNTQTNYPIVIGRNASPWTDEYRQGYYDEVRISRIQRSTNWIWACWMNQGTNHDSFAEYGTPQLPYAIQNLAATEIQSGSATFNGALSSAGATNTVWVHWGTTDATTNDT